jgi:hypothetical protein
MTEFGFSWSRVNRVEIGWFVIMGMIDGGPWIAAENDLEPTLAKR